MLTNEQRKVIKDECRMYIANRESALRLWKEARKSGDKATEKVANRMFIEYGERLETVRRLARKL